MDRRTLGAAYLWVTERFPYLASAVVAMRVVPAPGIGGAAVDESWRLYIDPDVAKTWSVPELGALLVHHAGHMLRDHAGRARSIAINESTADRWSRACDAELNDDLDDVGITPPGEVVLPEQFGAPRGRVAEEYFALVPDESDAHDHGSGAHGVPRSWEEGDGDGAPDGVSAHEGQLIRGRVADDVLQAAREGRGDIPGSLLRWASDLLEPKVSWRKVLAAEIRRGVRRVSGRVDYSYRRPSRRATISADVILPSMEAPVPELAIVCDTSGSMGDELLAKVLAEVEGLLGAIGMRSSGARVLAVDAAVQVVSRVTKASQVRLAGGGGTDMGAGLAAAAALRPRPSVVVVLTDGYTPWPAEPPRGISVIVALMGPVLRSEGRSGPYVNAMRDRVPSWARVVVVVDDEAA
jgi:predicted metal-dependent peptidase